MRNKLVFRIALYFGSAIFATAFSGWLSFDVFQIDSKLHGWQYLFLIEGGLAILGGFFALYWLPGTSAECRWLTDSERNAARARMLCDGLSMVNEKFNLKEAMPPFKG
ncbi:hypothetical protein B0O99DRAFT_684630 [Bisporella sp. PMI_857]|nr:hypothetical protein B0O99DRAFT_684630 [Bisporella sp. PMI_857]